MKNSQKKNNKKERPKLIKVRERGDVNTLSLMNSFKNKFLLARKFR